MARSRSDTRHAHEGALSILVFALGAATAHAHPAEAASAPAADAGAGFHLEGRPQLDDVFGDSSDYRRTLDRFLELTRDMQTMRDDFAKTVQAALAELAKPVAKGKRHCPEAAVATLYSHARKLGNDYLRVGRELTRHYAQVKEFDRLGETVGLTPDYRWKVKRVLQQYGALLTDYREMKVALHDQLDHELKFAGCDLKLLLVRGDPQVATAIVDDSWPQPGQPGAPGVLPPTHSTTRESPPIQLPPEKVPPPQPIPLPRRAQPGEAEAPRSGVLFYVDNTRCQRGTQVFLDGKRLGEVPAATRVGFQTAAGPHDLCLLDDTKKQCGEAGTTRRSYLHEGWTISLRCE